MNPFKFLRAYLSRCKIPTKQEVKDFFPEYLENHKHPANKAIHLYGNGAVVGSIAAMIIALFVSKAWLLVGLILLVAWFGIYPFAWAGHYLFEKNEPATFKANPLVTKACDWIMCWKLIKGSIRFDTRGNE